MKDKVLERQELSSETKRNIALGAGIGATFAGTKALSRFLDKKWSRDKPRNLETEDNPVLNIAEYEILQFNKRGYTSKYPGFSIPSTLSTPSMKKIIKHLSAVVSARLSQNDNSADKFDGTKSNYDEKVSLQKE